MIDTIHAYFHFDSNKNAGKVDHDKVLKHLKVNPNKDYEIINLKLFLLKIEFKNGKIKAIRLRGSLPKIIYTTNLKRSDLLAQKRAFLLLQKKLGFPISYFKVTRIDISINVNMKNDVRAYIEIMDSMKNHSMREQSAHSKRFFNKSNEFIVYDKVKELKARLNEMKEGRHKVSSNFIEEHERQLQMVQGQNILRLELRVKSKFQQDFGIQEMYIHQLLDKKFYEKYPSVFLKKFEMIYLFPDLHYVNIKTAKDLTDFLIMKGIEAQGKTWGVKSKVALSKLIEKIDQASVNNVNKRIRQAQENEVVVNEKEITKELLSKVNRALALSENVYRNFNEWPLSGHL